MTDPPRPILRRPHTHTRPRPTLPRPHIYAWQMKPRDVLLPNVWGLTPLEWARQSNRLDVRFWGVLCVSSGWSCERLGGARFVCWMEEGALRWPGFVIDLTINPLSRLLGMETGGGLHRAALPKAQHPHRPVSGRAGVTRTVVCLLPTTTPLIHPHTKTHTQNSHANANRSSLPPTPSPHHSAAASPFVGALNPPPSSSSSSSSPMAVAPPQSASASAPGPSKPPPPPPPPSRQRTN